MEVRRYGLEPGSGKQIATWRENVVNVVSSHVHDSLPSNDSLHGVTQNRFIVSILKISCYHIIIIMILTYYYTHIAYINGRMVLLMHLKLPFTGLCGS